MNRRQALVGAAAALATAARVATSENRAAAAGIATLRQFVKLRGALDERLVIGFVIGRFDGVVDEVVTPLFGVLSAVFSRYRYTGSEYVVVAYEQAYYTDLETGRVVDRMRNPYTGAVVDVPVYSRPPPVPQSRRLPRERPRGAVRAGSAGGRGRSRLRRGGVRQCGRDGCGTGILVSGPYGPSGKAE
jgi:hypothetical protein